jgi:hypothetical protein
VIFNVEAVASYRYIQRIEAADEAEAKQVLIDLIQGGQVRPIVGPGIVTTATVAER